MGSEDHRNGVTPNITWLEALEIFLHQRERVSSRRQLITSILLISCAIVLLVHWITNYNWLHWQWVLGGIVVGAVIIVFRRWKPKQPEINEDLLMQLESAGLAERISSGELFNEKIREHTLWFARWTTPRLKGKEKVGLLSRIASNTHWYLMPPGLHWGGDWKVIQDFAAGSILAWLICVPFHPYWVGLYEGNIAVLFFGYFVLTALLNNVPHASTYTLASYLRRSWETTERGTEARAFDPEDNTKNITVPVSTESTYSMDLIINQSEKLIEKNTEPLSMFPMLIIILFPLLLGNSRLNFSIYYAVLFGLCIFALMWLLKKWTKSATVKYNRRLARSSIAEKLAGGELCKEHLLRHVPWIFKTFIDSSFMSRKPKGDGATITSDIVRVALTLEWYLKEPRTLIRPCWVTIPLAAIVGLGLFFAVQFRAYSISNYVTAPYEDISIKLMVGGAILFGLVCFSILLVESVNTSAGAKALIEYLRERRK